MSDTPNRSVATTIDEYLSEFDPDTRVLLERVRALIREVAPEATETMSYAIPTFDLLGTHLVHFAGFKNHIGFYPTGSGIEAFASELDGYKHSRGSVQFPKSEPLPEDLIRRMVEFRVEQVGHKR
jgi:uncharacterized protein YdhG (YjbR/CyaY superfamily)